MAAVSTQSPQQSTCVAGTPRAALDRSYSQPVDQAFSYNTLNNMNPRTYRNHAWAQLAKSDTFYIRGSPEERRLQTALGLDADSDAEAEDHAPDVEAQGMNSHPCLCCIAVRFERWDVLWM